MTLSLEERKYQREAKRKQRLNPDFVSLEYERNRKWREENKETISENKRLYYIKNKDRLVAYKKKASEERKKT